MKMISPNVKDFIIAHPSKVESLLNKGWKKEAVLSEEKVKSSLNKKSKDRVENGNT